jgi:hypothetical protein
MYEEEAEAIRKAMEQLTADASQRRVEFAAGEHLIVGYKVANAAEMLRFDIRPKGTSTARGEN